MCCLLTALLLSAGPNPGVTVETINYKGWADAICLRNGQVDVVLVPAVGRLLRFAPAGGDNFLWENAKWSGQTRPADFTDWFNVGGDKVWPAEQSQWPAVMSRGWPPETTLDGTPWKAAILPDKAVRLTSEVSKAYGIRATRTFRLEPGSAWLRIEQRFDKISGPPVRVCIWNVTQTNDPEAAYLPVWHDSPLPDGVFNFDRVLPNHRCQGDLLEIHRLPDLYSKYGTDSPQGWVAAVKNGWLFSEHCERRDGEYPDQGCCTEVYTEIDDVAKMVELEVLSPQAWLKPGQSLGWTVAWNLQPIPKGLSPERQAALVDKLLGPLNWSGYERSATTTKRGNW
jgi:hypothetical protein